MSVTLKDVAHDAGVGMSTASYVLTGSGVNKVSSETRKQILASAEKLGYMPNILARGLSCGKTFMIGVLLEEQEFANSFYPDILQGLEQVLDRNDYGLLLASYRNQSELETRCSYFLQRHVDGVAVFPAHWLDNAASLQKIMKRGVPVITMTRSFPGIPSVEITPFAIGETAAQYLVELGHRNIAYAGPIDSPRREGILSVLGKDECPTYGKHANYNFEMGEALFDWLLQLSLRPTAVIVESDIAAVALIRAAALHGLRLPDDLSVVGIDGLDLGRISLPSLTSVGQPTLERGWKAAEMLLDMIAGKTRESFYFHPRMIVRDSCCRIA